MTNQKIYTECPEGYYAVERDDEIVKCSDCAFFHCDCNKVGMECIRQMRKDGKKVIFKKIEK